MDKTYSTGEELRRRRETVGHSLNRASERLGIDKGQLSKIEAGEWKRMSVDAALRIREEYGIPLEAWVKSEVA